MKAFVAIARIVTGVLFIFSGLVKAIDPRGLGYKMEEFFEVFAREGYLPALMDSLHEYALPFSIIIITLEVVLGVALLLGWQKKFTAWMLLLLMILFTFLTSFVLFSGKIAACGCFGDCIPITPMQTFTKDIILLILILILVFKSEHIRPLFKPLVLLVYVLAAALLTVALQFYVLSHLPLADCLPFKKGNNIIELSKMPADAVADKYDYTFIYEKDGIKKEFTAADLPDSTWHFSERKQVLVQKGRNNVPLINDFKLNDAEGTDLTQSILNQPEYYLLFLEFPSNNTSGWISELRSLTSGMQGKTKIYLLTSRRSEAERFLQETGIIVDQLFTTDATAIKTAARSNPTLYHMNGPVVRNKWGWADFDNVKP